PTAGASALSLHDALPIWRLHGLEALARWHHPTLGTIPPDRFIPLAEECGLIGPLSRWVLEQACGQLAQWRREGLAVPAVAVNLSDRKSTRLNSSHVKISY